MAAKPQPAPPEHVTVPLLQQAIHLSDFNGMAPRPELRAQLAHIEHFVQNQPQDGNAPTESTEVWMGHTQSTLYFVFLCHDRHPELIRSHLARRENIFKDDYVNVLLDTFHDHRTGTVFSVNPAGVQSDASYSEANGTDTSYDQVWDSEGRITPEGWMALIAIPFRSLRFHDGGDWGVVFQRAFPRNSEQDYWPRISTNITGELTQEAILSGIHGVTGSHNIQINPYALAQSERRLQAFDPLHPYFSNRALEGTAGGEIKAILKDSIVFDATLNPDFSDIETDQPQFTVNQRYPVYFSELRPFFLENASFFNTPLTLVYTRSAVRPEYGARVTGKIGHSSIGLLAVDDRQPGEAVSAGDPLYHKRATIAVARYSRDFGKGSGIGAIYTDRELGSGWNRIGGIDFSARFNDQWSATGQMVATSTMTDQDNGSTYSAGPASNLWIGRSTHTSNANASYTDFSKGYISQLGFYSSSNLRSTSSYANHMWYPKHSIFQQIGVEINPNFAFDHDGNRVYHYINGDPFFTFARNIVFAPVVGQNSDTVSPASYSALSHYKNFTENFAGLVFRGQPFPQFTFNLQATRSGSVNYNPANNGAPFLLDQQQVRLVVTVAPLRQLTIDNILLLDRDKNAHNHELVFESQTYRTKMNYQFTRALSARAIVEYDSTRVHADQTSLQPTKEIGAQALLTWLPHPGTAIYLGYNNDLQNIDRKLCNRLPAPNANQCDPNNTDLPRSNDWMNDGKQFFVKASYLLRF